MLLNGQDVSRQQCYGSGGCDLYGNLWKLRSICVIFSVFGSLDDRSCLWRVWHGFGRGFIFHDAFVYTSKYLTNEEFRNVDNLILLIVIRCWK